MTVSRGIARTISVVFVFIMDPIAISNQHEQPPSRHTGKGGIFTDLSQHGHLCMTVEIEKRTMSARVKLGIMSSAPSFAALRSLHLPEGETRRFANFFVAML